MESVWESGAATAFQGSFTEFNKAMVTLGEALSNISSDFAKINEDINNIVNNDILTTVNASAERCVGDADNLDKYATAEEENIAAMASAYGG